VVNFGRICFAERKEIESKIINGVNVKIPRAVARIRFFYENGSLNS